MLDPCADDVVIGCTTGKLKRKNPPSSRNRISIKRPTQRITPMPPSFNEPLFGYWNHSTGGLATSSTPFTRFPYPSMFDSTPFATLPGHSLREGPFLPPPPALRCEFPPYFNHPTSTAFQSHCSYSPPNLGAPARSVFPHYSWPLLDTKFPDVVANRKHFDTTSAFSVVSRMSLNAGQGGF